MLWKEEQEVDLDPYQDPILKVIERVSRDSLPEDIEKEVYGQ
jgi:hypothetical protein